MNGIAFSVLSADAVSVPAPVVKGLTASNCGVTSAGLGMDVAKIVALAGCLVDKTGCSVGWWAMGVAGMGVGGAFRICLVRNGVCASGF